MANEFMSPWVLPVMTVLGGALNYSAKIGAGRATVTAAQRKQVGGNFSADQMDINAGQQQAAAQQAAQEELRIGEYGDSKIVARAAAQGGSSTDPSVMLTRARVMAEGAYRASQDLYKGDETARGMHLNAAATRYMGDTTVADAQQVEKASKIAGAATLLDTGAKTMAMKYNFDRMTA